MGNGIMDAMNKCTRALREPKEKDEGAKGAKIMDKGPEGIKINGQGPLRNQK